MWEETVEKSPKCACYEGCHDEHKVTRGEVDGGVECGGNEETFGESVALGKAFLHKATPEDFFGWTYDAKEEKGEKVGGDAAFYSIECIDFGACCGE